MTEVIAISAERSAVRGMSSVALRGLLEPVVLALAREP
jgi:hypothetical protein